MGEIEVKVVTIDHYDKWFYTLTTAQAFDMLKEEGLTRADDPQVIQRWLKEGKIKAVIIKKGRQEDRGYRINEKSLLEYARSVSRTPEQWLAEVDLLKGQVFRLQLQVDQYEKEKEEKAARAAKRKEKAAQKTAGVVTKRTKTPKTVAGAAENAAEN